MEQPSIWAHLRNIFRTNVRKTVHKVKGFTMYSPYLTVTTIFLFFCILSPLPILPLPLLVGYRCSITETILFFRQSFCWSHHSVFGRMHLPDDTVLLLSSPLPPHPPPPPHALYLSNMSLTFFKPQREGERGNMGEYR